MFCEHHRRVYGSAVTQNFKQFLVLQKTSSFFDNLFFKVCRRTYFMTNDVAFMSSVCKLNEHILSDRLHKTQNSQHLVISMVPFMIYAEIFRREEK